ncbi:MAG: biotin--[acetyl-CoA-carboxylase] ligase [Bacteroidia bacterium]|nr:biotin--[acetyl-CoA-carboxylase] ligase [Bacteroidia bacterium]
MSTSTLFIGQNKVDLSSVDSTNNYAAELLKNTAIADGTVIWSHEQTHGRGQRGNKWLSVPGQNLTISIVLHPAINASKQFYLTKAVSLGLTEMIKGIVDEKADIKIKWPNDIYAGNKKIAGILIENNLRGDNIVNSIVGIGLNINQINFNPAITKASSLRLITGKQFDINTCINQLCTHFEPRYLQMKAEKHRLLNNDYHHALYRLNEIGNYKKNNSVFNAILTGVSEEGKLTLKHADGKIANYDFKEVEFV